MKEKDTPLRLIRWWTNQLHDVYAQMDTMAALNGNEPTTTWPDYCDLPMNAALTLLVDTYGLTMKEAASVAAELTAYGICNNHVALYVKL